MVNRIPNGSLLTNKLGLLNSLQEYARVSSNCMNCILHLPILFIFYCQMLMYEDACNCNF